MSTPTTTSTTTTSTTSTTTTTTTSTTSTNVRRILKEISDLKAESSDRFAISLPEDDLFQLHFTIRGPASTPFQHGLYHGRLVLPPQYPFKPPEIYFMTPNGRFETRKKICLSVSSYHEESWQPAWVRTILLGISSYMAYESEGAIGSVRWTDSDRLALAASSLQWTCPDCQQSNEQILPITGDVIPIQDESAQLAFTYDSSMASSSTNASSSSSSSIAVPPTGTTPAPPVVAEPYQSWVMYTLDKCIMALVVCIGALLLRRFA